MDPKVFLRKILDYLMANLFLYGPLLQHCLLAILFIFLPKMHIKSLILEYTPDVLIIDRPDHLAQDTSSTDDVVLDSLKTIISPHIILMQATSPLTSSSHILSSVKQYTESTCQSLLSGTLVHDFFWSEQGFPLNYSPISRPRRQDWLGTFKENGAIYIFARESFLLSGSRLTPPCSLYVMDHRHSIELDTPNDWTALEEIASESSSYKY